MIKHSEEFKREAVRIALTSGLLRERVAKDLGVVRSTEEAEAAVADVAAIIRMIAAYSARPRYTFMVLDLIARVARPNGQAGPLVRDCGKLVPIREWLAMTIAPSAARHPQRRVAAQKVRAVSWLEANYQLILWKQNVWSRPRFPSEPSKPV